MPSPCLVAPPARRSLAALYHVVLVLLLLIGLVSGLQAEEAARRPESLLPREIRNSLGMEFVLIEPGTFAMGVPPTEPGRFLFDEDTLHQVTLSQPFYLGKYEVTQAQWQAVMGSNPSHFSACGGTCPVERVSWEAAQTFITALNVQEGGSVYRLPTEAEWEYAARAGTQSRRIILGMTRPGWGSMGGMWTTPAAGPTPSGRSGQMRGGSMTCTGTCGSGSTTGMSPTRPMP